MAYFSVEETRDKLVILYFLEASKLSLNEEQLIHIFAKQHWMDYFSFAAALSALKESELVQTEHHAIGVCLCLSEEGKRTIYGFSGRIPLSIRRKIDEYLEKKRPRLQQWSQNHASYKKQSDDAYIVDLTIHERDRVLLQLQINTPTAEIARSYCDKWPRCAEDIYASIINGLGEENAAEEEDEEE